MSSFLTSLELILACFNLSEKGNFLFPETSLIIFNLRLLDKE